MTLKETQRRMAAALMAPLTAKDRIARRGRKMEEAASLIKPNSRLGSLDRLEIYSRSYWFRLLDSFREDFPGLAAVLGARAFERLARAYLADRPSESFTLRNLGSRLEAWLGEHPGYAGENTRLALDMVRLEWAHVVAFDGPADEVPGPEDLAELSPDLRAGLQPYLSLLQLHYPVDEIRIRASGGQEGEETDSQMKFRRAGRSIRLIRPPAPETSFVAVHRLDLQVYYRRLSAEEFRLLEALRAGRPIGRAIEFAFRESRAVADEIPGLLKLWFATWAEFGWLTTCWRARTSRGART